MMLKTPPPHIHSDHLADDRREDRALPERSPPREEHPSGAGTLTSGRHHTQGGLGGLGGSPPPPEQVKRPIWDEGRSSTVLNACINAGAVDWNQALGEGLWDDTVRLM